MAKRNLFDELMQGVAAMKAHRLGELAARSDNVELQEPAAIHGQVGIRRLRGNAQWEDNPDQSRRGRIHSPLIQEPE